MSGSKTSLDRMEQTVRIELMRADILAKRQSLIFTKYQLYMTAAGAIAALLAAIFTGIKLLFGS